MQNMVQITVYAETARAIRALVAAGEFPNEGEVVRAALFAMQERVNRLMEQERARHA